jgi:hypothetical protein
VPDDLYPVDPDHAATRPIPVDDRLAAGPQSIEVQVRRPTEVIEGGLDHGVLTLDDRAQGSNHCVFLLAPHVASIAPNNVASAAFEATTLVVNGTRLFKAAAKSVVLVGDIVLPVIDSDPADPQTDTAVHVSLSALARATPPLPPGTYPVRVMSGGVQSLGSVPLVVT